MSRKDYELIAAALRAEMDLFKGETSPFALTQRATIIAIAQRIALSLSEDNPRFNSERFLEAAIR